MPTRILLIAIVSWSFVHPGFALTPSKSIWRRAHVPPEGFIDPTNNNGSMLTFGFTTFPPNLGEPLNVIISANSDPDVLKDQDTDGGLRNYFSSFQFSPECLGQHLGSHQMADLGDGGGARNETAVIRYNYNDTSFGTCKESVQGGNHFRYWTQNGANADSGAIFMVVSYELSIDEAHDLIFNGYNLGRDWLVGNITDTAIPTPYLSNTTSYVGTTQFGGYTYQTSVNYTGGLLQNTSTGINHYLSVGGGPLNITAQDGLVAVLTVKITGRSSNSSRSLAASYIIPSSMSTLAPVSLLVLLLSMTAFAF